MDDLKKQAEELGIKVDGRWSAERLQAEIDEKLAADPEPEAPVVEPVAEAEPEPEVEAPVTDEALAAANAEIQAEIEARGPADDRTEEREVAPEAEEPVAAEETGVTLVNLQPNPMSALGLTSYGEVTLTALQLADPRFCAKVDRAINLGLVKVK